MVPLGGLTGGPRAINVPTIQHQRATRVLRFNILTPYIDGVRDRDLVRHQITTHCFSLVSSSQDGEISICIEYLPEYPHGEAGAHAPCLCLNAHLPRIVIELS